MATNSPFSFTTIVLAVLLLKLITNSRNFLARKTSLARRATDDWRSSTAVNTAWRICHDQETQSSKIGRRNSEQSEQILRMVCGRSVLQEKPFVVPFTRTPRVLQGRKSFLMIPHRLSWESTLILALCCLIASPTLNGLASSSPKMKSDHSLEWCDVDQDPGPVA